MGKKNTSIEENIVIEETATEETATEETATEETATEETTTDLAEIERDKAIVQSSKDFGSFVGRLANLRSNSDGVLEVKGYDKDSKTEITVEVSGEVASNTASLFVIADIESMSDKAKAFHISEIKEEDVKKKGYSGKADYIAQNSKKLSKTTVSKLNRVGRIFLTHSVFNTDGTPVYEYRKGIPHNALISNLEECLTLLVNDKGEKLEKVDFDKLTEKQCDSIVARFVKKYCKEPNVLLHVEASQKTFREELRALSKPTTESNSNSNSDSNSDSNSNGGENELSDKARCVIAVQTLTSIIGTDSEIAEMLFNITEYINSHLTDSDSDTDSESDSDTDSDSDSDTDSEQ